MLFHLQICRELQEGVSPEKQVAGESEKRDYLRAGCGSREQNGNLLVVYLFEGKMREQRAERQLDCRLLHPVKHQYPAKVFDLYLNVHRGVK